MKWQNGGNDGSNFIEAAKAHPGWYWVARPHAEGPDGYDPQTPVLSLVHVDQAGAVRSQMAGLRALDRDSLCPQNADGHIFATWFAGPVEPGEASGKLSVERAGPDNFTTLGEAPAVPGWYWCRTNSEAPLLHVDADQYGPIYLDKKAGADIHVWSAATASGTPVDIGELGFSEPLVSAGGIIDASGELGRVAVEFFGGIALPEELPASPWPQNKAPLDLGAFSVSLAVKDLAKSQAFYLGLGFEIIDGKAEQGWLMLKQGQTKLGLFQGMFEENLLTFHPQDVRHIQSRLKSEGYELSKDAEGSEGPGHIVLKDPDGNTLLIDQH